MLLGLTHVCLPVRHLKRSRTFYEKQLGLQVVGDDHSFVDLTDGSVILRLLRTVHRGAPVTLRFQTQQVEVAAARLVDGGGQLIRRPQKVDDTHLVAEVLDPESHTLVLWRTLREDELDREIDLPTTVPWSPIARDLLRSMLSEVPVMFRDLARQGMVREAEFLAQNTSQVEEIHAVRAAIRATPRMMRQRVQGALRKYGFRPEDFQVDFSC